MKRFYTFVLACALTLLVLPAVFAQPGPSVDEIKTWLDSPVILYGLMLLGSLASGLKQWTVARMEGSTSGLGSYFSFIPEGIVTLIGNTIAFVALIYSDQLNFISAVSIGYVINSASDLLPNGSRSTSLQPKE